MTVPTPDATRCPDCSAALTDSSACPACGLPLTGPHALRLWQVDLELAALDGRRDGLLAERRGLLLSMRSGSAAGAASPARSIPDGAIQGGSLAGSRQAGAPTGQLAYAGSAPSGRPQTAPVARREWTPKRVQNTLLTLGALLLGVAATVFAAVTYDRLGAGGRATVLVLLTALTASAVAPLVRRGLASTAETLTAVTVVLSMLDAYGLRRLGFFDTADSLTYAAASALVIAAVAAAGALVVPVKVAGLTAVLAPQLSVLLVLAAAEASPSTTGLALAALAGADLLVATVLPRAVLSGAVLSRAVGAHVRTTLLASAVLAGGAGLFISVVATVDSAADAVPALLAHAALLAGASVVARDRVAQALLSAAPVGVLAVAAYAVLRDDLDVLQQPLVPVTVGLLALGVAALLPGSRRAGPLGGGLVVSAVAVLEVGRHAITGLLLPAAWTTAPWSVATGSSARDSLAADYRWGGDIVTVLVLLAAAGAVVAAAALLRPVREALPAAAGLGLAAVVLLPLGLDLSYAAALSLLLVVATGLLAGGVAGHRARPRPTAAEGPDGTGRSPAALADSRVRLGLLGAGAAVTLLACLWSLADRDASLVVLALSALLAAVVSASAAAALPGVRAAATGLAGLLAAAWLAAVGAAADLSVDQVGSLLLVVSAVLLALAAVTQVGPARRDGAEPVAVVVVLVALVLASRDVGWLSWTLAGAALLALATALRPDRRSAAVVGGLLLSASSWVRLLAAEVSAPEPYVLPLAAIALVLGHLRRRRVPATRSFAAYGPGLSVLLVPSLLASFDDADLTRPLLVAVAALAVLLVGAATRLQAPLTIGAGVLAVDALQLLGPYAAALPRWVVIGAIGTLLVGVGATYEQRRRDVDVLRNRYDALA